MLTWLADGCPVMAGGWSIGVALVVAGAKLGSGWTGMTVGVAMFCSSCNWDGGITTGVTVDSSTEARVVAGARVAKLTAELTCSRAGDDRAVAAAPVTIAGVEDPSEATTVDPGGRDRGVVAERGAAIVVEWMASAMAWSTAGTSGRAGEYGGGGDSAVVGGGGRDCSCLGAATTRVAVVDDFRAGGTRTTDIRRVGGGCGPKRWKGPEPCGVGLRAGLRGSCPRPSHVL